MNAAWQRAWQILPHYLSGLAWLACITILVAFTFTPSEAAAISRAVAGAIPSTRIPDVAIGFVFSVFGLLLPYTIGVVFGPLSVLFGNMVATVFPDTTTNVTVDEQATVVRRLTEQLGVPPTDDDLEDLLYFSLRQAGSPLVNTIEQGAMSSNLQAYCSVPVSILSGLLTVALLDARWLGWLAGSVVAIGMYLLTVYAAGRQSVWQFEMVLHSYLVASSNVPSTSVELVMRNENR